MRARLILVLVLYVVGCQNLTTYQEAPHPAGENVSFAQVKALKYSPAQTTLYYGDDPLQFGKLWLPKTLSSPPPLVIFVHGGCWLSAYDLTHSFALASALNDAGFAVWTVEYRRTGDPGGGWPGSVNDVVQAINFIQARQAWSQVALVGHSAGGHLAFHASQRIQQPVDQTIGLAPIIDVVAYSHGDNSCQRATHAFLGGTPQQRPAEYADATLVNTRFDGKVAILTGGMDKIVPLPENPLPTASFYQEPAAGHFDWVHPGTPAFVRLVELLQTK